MRAFKAARVIKLNFNFDGLPISKCSGLQVWPLLMSTDIFSELVQVVGVYYGKGKPTAEVLVQPLVDELAFILKSGFELYDDSGTLLVQNPVAVEYIVCDLPALALVKCIKGHSGYASCPKCTVYGEHVNSRCTFIPSVHNALAAQRRRRYESDGEILTDLLAEPVANRTDKSFR